VTTPNLVSSDETTDHVHAPADPGADGVGVGSDGSQLGRVPVELLGTDVDKLVQASYRQLPPRSDYEARRRRRSVVHLTRWLAQFPGATWQARWVASGLDKASIAWPDVTEHTRRGLLFKGAQTLICLGVLQPDYPWLLDTRFASLFQTFRQANDPAGFAALEDSLRALRISDQVLRQAIVAATRICIHSGKTTPVAITADDVLELATALRATGRWSRAGLEALWRALHSEGQIAGPTSLKAAHRPGPLTVEQLVDRYQLRCRPIRDLIVSYIAERAPAMDYPSVSNLAFWLAKLFWADLERHHPGIDSLHLDHEVAAAWKKRVAVRTDSRGLEVPRSNRHVVLATVRAFYLDLNQWAYEDPARWVTWAAPCPVRKSEVAARAKHKAQVRAKMHARTRTLAEVVPTLVATARTRRQHAHAVLDSTRGREVGTVVVVD
jgi:hypothetical protein